MRTDPEPNAARQLLYQLLPIDNACSCAARATGRPRGGCAARGFACICCSAAMLLWALLSAGQFVPGKVDADRRTHGSHSAAVDLAA
jgi:hypothetical protein